MNLSSGRYSRLLYTLEGLKRTGKPLLGFNGTEYMPAERGDDLGLYYFVPKIMGVLHLDLQRAINLFLGGIILGAAILGIFGFFKYSRNWVTRFYSTAIVGALSVFCFWTGDIYVVSFAITMAVVPIFVYLIFKSSNDKIVLFFTFFSSLLCALANQFRLHAGTGVMLFMAMSILLVKISPRKKILLGFILCLGTLMPSMYFARLLSSRDRMLKQIQNNPIETEKGHIFWSPIYVGMSYLTNDYGIPNNDQDMKKYISDRYPLAVYPTKEYERVCRNELFKLVKAHPYFILRTIFSKLGSLFLYVFLAGNIGLVLGLFSNVGFKLKASLGLLILFGSLPGLLTTPYFLYVLTMITAISIYGVYGLDKFMERYEQTAN